MKREHTKKLFGSKPGRTDSNTGGRVALCSLLALCLTVSLSAPTSASAGTASSWHLISSFDGSDTTAGKFFGPGSIAIDQPSGTVYVIDRIKATIDKFNLAGQAQPFSATGESSLDPEIGELRNSAIAVDSYGPNAGRFYVTSRGHPTKAFAPSGEPLWTLEGLPKTSGVAVDIQGHIWLANDDFESPTIEEYAGSGAPPVKLATIPSAASMSNSLALDASGNAYYSSFDFRKLDTQAGVDTRIGSGSVPRLFSYAAVDQSSADGHIFVLQHDQNSKNLGFSEFSSTGSLLGEGFGREDFETEGNGIAYDSVNRHIYASSSHPQRVFVYDFLTVTTPDVSLEPITQIGNASAQLHGTVNPLGVNNSWHFEWKAHDKAWSEASSSPAQVLPVDSDTHAVTFKATGLSAKTIYDVRLVALNTDANVRAVSTERTFGNIAPTLTLLAAAPRSDTTARLNASIELSGNSGSVRFELSDDEGETWSALPSAQVDESVTPLVVGWTLTNLVPSTSYRYRATVENERGASPLDTERSFTTRSVAETTIPPRGYELVNTPEKGNQNAVSLPIGDLNGSPMSADGDSVLWTVSGGAPGGVLGYGNAFLAHRDADGWHSTSILPAAQQLVGGGTLSYNIVARAFSFSHFAFTVSDPAAAMSTLVNVDTGQHQEILATYEGTSPDSTSPHGTFRVPGAVDITDDGTSVVVLNQVISQFERVDARGREIVSIMPDGTPASCGVHIGGSAGSGISALRQPEYHTIATTDASRIYLEVAPNGNCSSNLGLYVRDILSDTTTLIDPGASGKETYFIRASRDGHEAFFATYTALDSLDKNTHLDIYRWNEADGSSTCLTCVVPDANLAITGGGVPRSVLVSADGSHVYFQSRSQLIPGLGSVDGVKLYVLDQGELGFVADTGVADDLDSPRPQLSSDGRILEFVANYNPNLTADVVAALQCIAPRSGVSGCQQLYRYDDRDESLECLSCLAGGVTTHSVGARAGNSGGSGDLRASEDGSTVAFATQEALLPLDVNRDTDIYEWRNGTLRLLTDGVSSFQDGFAAPQVRAVDADGFNILFSVVEPGLTGFESDGLANLYDARLGGGFEPPSPPAHCSGDACQGPLVASPSPGLAASEGLSGQGNISSRLGRRGRCAAKHGAARRRCLSRHKKQRNRGDVGRAKRNAGGK